MPVRSLNRPSSRAEVQAHVQPVVFANYRPECRATSHSRKVRKCRTSDIHRTWAPSNSPCRKRSPRRSSLRAMVQKTEPAAPIGTSFRPVGDSTGLAWCEELDQIRGQSEIRLVDGLERRFEPTHRLKHGWGNSAAARIGGVLATRQTVTRCTSPLTAASHKIHSHRIRSASRAAVGIPGVCPSVPETRPRGSVRPMNTFAWGHRADAGWTFLREAASARHSGLSIIHIG